MSKRRVVKKKGRITTYGDIFGNDYCNDPQLEKLSVSKKEVEIFKYINNKSCEICSQKDKEEQILLCDRCDDAYHLSCLTLSSLPNSQWICPQCIIDTQKIHHSTPPITHTCYLCKLSLSNPQTLQILDQLDHPQKITLYRPTQCCVYCNNKFHDGCFSIRQNAVNCSSCEKQLRSKWEYILVSGPRNDCQFKLYIRSHKQQAIQQYEMLTPRRVPRPQRIRHLNLKLPKELTKWQLITQHQASLYYALETKKIRYINQQIYQKGKISVDKNDIYVEEGTLALHEKDQQVFEAFKQNQHNGSVGPFQIKQCRVRGFYLTATDFIERNTIIGQYVGQVMSTRQSLLYQENDSIFNLIRSARSKDSLDIVPNKFGNIAKFICGVNNTQKTAKNLENVKAIRFQYEGRIRVLLYAKKQIQAEQTLYFDYNGSAFQEYPTHQFIN